MSFNTALSGLNAATSDLGVTSNNIANVNTTGFKFSRAEFADIYATSAFGAGRTAIGAGTLLSNVAQQFTQGNLQYTSSALDMAVLGEGFFVLTPDANSTEKIYTRAGAFGVDDAGNVVNASGNFLQAFDVNPDGTVRSTSLSNTINLVLPQTAGAPQASSEVELGVNLDSDETALDPLLFDPTDSNSYSHSTGVTFYDSLGNTHVQSFYFVRDNTVANQWAVYTTVDDAPVDILGGPAAGSAWAGGNHLYGTILFDSFGVMVSSDPLTAPPGQFVTEPLGAGGAGVPSYANGPDPTQTMIIDMGSNTNTQFSGPFLVNTLSQDGFGVGRLSGLDIDTTGVVNATFSNGQTLALGKVALVNFPNSQGLGQNGNTTWSETTASGAALAGEAGTGSLGSIRSGALEASNVDLTLQLVNLITAQRNFQANARAIETATSATQTILQIR